MSGNAMQQFSERNEILTTTPPTDAKAAVGAHASDYVDLAEFHRAFILILLGEAASGATIDVTVNEATDTDGSDAQELTAKAPDQIVEGDEGGYVGIELQTEELDVDDGFHCISVTTTVGSDTYHHGVVIFGVDARYPPCGVTGYTELVE